VTWPLGWADTHDTMSSANDTIVAHVHSTRIEAIALQQR
jgi:hypothetical protein